MKLKNIHAEVSINVTPEQMWKVLSRYGDVSQFHGGVRESHPEGESTPAASLGCERVCNIVDMGLQIQLKERIVDYVEGVSYAYDVYEWKNFPVQAMRFGFALREISPNSTTLVLDIDYRAKPAWLTPLLAPKMKKLARDILLGYKHFAETGEKRVPLKALKQRYSKPISKEMQFG